MRQFENTCLLSLQVWKVVNEKAKSAGRWRCETFNADTERNGMHATIFLFKGTVSFQFAAVRLLYVGKFRHILSATSLHNQTICSTLWQKDTMGSHIHSVLACSLKKEEHCTKKKKVVRLNRVFFCVTFQIHSRALWHEKNIFHWLFFPT